MVASTETATRLGDKRWRELLATYRQIVRRALRHAGGREVDNAGDGFLAVFEQPALALTCASTLTDDLHAAGIDVRTGMHMGEVETVGEKLGGIAVHIGARVAAMAGPGQVLVSSTIRDVASGSEFGFADEGVHALKGVTGEWRIFRVDWPGAKPLDHAALHAWEVGTGPAHRRGTVRTVAVGAAGVVVAGAAVGVAVTLLRASTTSSVIPSADTVARINGPLDGFAMATTVGVHPTGVAIGGGSIWVVNYSDQTLTRLDAGSGRVVSTKSVSGTPTGVAYGSGSLWVTAGFGLASGAGGAVLQFDAITGNEVRSIPAGDGLAGAAFGLGELWVADRIDNTVIEIDPTSDSVVATIPAGKSPDAVAVCGNLVCAVNTLDQTLVRIDPRTHTAGGPIALGFAPDAVAANSAGIWVVGTSANRVAHLDPSGVLVTTIAVHTGPVGIAIAGGDVWVADGTARTVDRINAAGNRVIASLPVRGEPTAVVAAPDGSVWVTVSS
jgi:YVTN family beta-propeller protein